jgi:hypothetical protein
MGEKWTAQMSLNNAWSSVACNNMCIPEAGLEVGNIAENSKWPSFSLLTRGVH